MNRLRRNQMCPLHRSFFCCGRNTPFTRKNAAPKLRHSTPDSTIIEDRFHPRGYREKCSPRELTRRKMRLMLSGVKLCFYCQQEFTDFREVELAHKEPKGMGGARHDDHMENLTLAHHACNHENGSRRPVA